MARNHYIDEILQPVVYPTYRPWSQVHCSKTTTPEPTAPGSWTHTYSNNISTGPNQTWEIGRFSMKTRRYVVLNSIEHVWDQLGRVVMLTVLVLISEGFWWRSGTCCRRTMCSVWYTACAGDVQLALLHVVALPTVDVMSKYNDYKIHTSVSFRMFQE